MRPGESAEERQNRLDFVRRAEAILFGLRDPRRYVRLRERIDRVRDGLEILREPVTDLDAFVENL